MTTLTRLSTRSPYYADKAERIWKLADRVADYRAENCKDGDTEAAVLSIVINKLHYAARYCEAGEDSQAVGYMMDARCTVTSEALADAIAVLAAEISGHPLECGCVLPEQSCPACRDAAGGE